MAWLDELRQRLEQEPDITPDAVVSIIASEWGGCRLYVPSKRPVEPQITHRDTPKTIAQRYSVSRSTAHSWMIRYRKR